MTDFSQITHADVLACFSFAAARERRIRVGPGTAEVVAVIERSRDAIARLVVDENAALLVRDR